MRDYEERTIKKAIVINVLISVLVVIAVIWMMTDTSSISLSGRRLQAFRFFTVDSNILMGISAAFMAIAQMQVIKGKRKSISTALYVLKLASTVAVAITMLVTVFYLGFVIPTGFFSLFYHSNFIMHLAVPVLSIVVFVLYEKTDCIALKHNLFSYIPLVLYGIYYAIATFSHMKNGVVEKGYDWYQFFKFGTKSVLLVYPFFAGFVFLLSYVLWKLNRAGKSTQAQA